MRGALARWLINAVVSRIIPAYAGSTGVAVVLGEDAQDHPRVCGEHQDSRPRQEWRAGSSPRMRGAQRAAQAVRGDRGIIPAYAGSTADMIQAGQPPQDHPGVCGEHALAPTQISDSTGSSPRMRGAHVQMNR